MGVIILSKPTLTQFPTLPPMKLYQYERYLPTAFDDTLTMVEKINKVIQYLNQIGELTNDVVEQWNQVMEWILNEGLSASIIEQLLKWRDDGTLATIINEEILGKKATIIVSKTEPSPSDSTTYWFKDMGDGSINFPPDNNGNGGNIIVSDYEPPKNYQFWYDILKRGE